MNTKNLKEFEIANGVLVKYNGNKEQIVIPDEVTEIGWNAFDGCKNITSIMIPHGVTSISCMGLINRATTANYVFSECTSLENIIVSENNPVYKSIDGNLYSKDGTRLIKYMAGKNDTSFIVPESVTTIGNEAFRDCERLKSIMIPNSITSIGEYAFSFCKNLLNIGLPNSVKSISRGAFRGCVGLKSIIIPDGVEEIDCYAFWGCIGLKSITIPQSIKNIYQDAFGGGFEHYIEIENVYYEGGIAGWCGILGLEELIQNCSISSKIYINGKELAGEIIIPDGVTNISNGAFAGCSGLKNVVIPNSVTSIGEGAFCKCSGLTSIVIPDSVITIGNHSFDGCIGLASVTIGKGVMSIGNGAFCSCSSLTSITIPSTVKTIGCFVFQNCIALEIVYWNAIDSTREDFYIYEDDPDFYNDEAYHYSLFYGCSNLITVIIGENVKTIPTSAFAYCSGLKRITIPNGVVRIGYGAFYNCSSLTSVTFGSSLKAIGSEAFYNCSNLSEILIPENVISIGDMAFGCCASLEKVRITDSLKHIGYDVFPFDYSYEINIPDGVTTIEDDEFGYDYASIFIPITVTKIGKNAFSRYNECINYEGTEEQWQAIDIDENPELMIVNINFNCTRQNH